MKMVVLALAALMLAGCGGDPPEEGSPDGDLPLTYERGYGGVAGGTAELRIDDRTNATLVGGPPGPSCSTGEKRFQLSLEEVGSVHTVLETAHQIEPRVREELAVEAPRVELVTEDVTLRYVGFDAVPPEARKLVKVLDRLIANHCAVTDPQAELPLTYQREYGGAAGGGAKLRIDPGGKAILFGGPPGAGCATEDKRFRLSDDELGYVQGLLDSAHEIEPRVVDEPATEAPSFALRAGRVKLRYVGYDVVPEDAQVLFDALDDIAETHCALITP